jgi:hypothetical protein
MGYLQGQYARRHSPRPNPFLQGMMPPSHPFEDEKQTGADRLGTEEVKDQAEFISLGGAENDTKPNGTTSDVSTQDESHSINQPDSDGIVVQSEDTNPLETNESTSVVTVPEPVFKPPPMRKWSDLTQSEKLDVMWTLCEWQFTGAMRLRSLLGEEDSGVGWVSTNASIQANSLIGLCVANGACGVGQ